MRLSIVLVTTLLTLFASQYLIAASDDLVILQPTNDFSKAEPYEALPGGALTYSKKINRDAFSHASANMSFERQADFQVGNALFQKLWVSSPSSTKKSDGLGPLFNARACQHCHIKDGRGHPPESSDDTAVSMLMRLSKVVRGVHQNDAVYGGQLQDFSVAGVLAEGNIGILYSEKKVALDDGEVITLREPRYHIAKPLYGAVSKELMLSPRVAPQMIGLGLLEAIDSADIIAAADPDDDNRDGISGRAKLVWSKALQQKALGRFGHRSEQATLDDQNQGAFNGDMGLSTPLNPNSFGDCTDAQTECNTMPHGGDENGLEVSQDVVKSVLHYTRNLAVPARRDVADKSVLEGKQLFYQSGCISCHTPKYITPRSTAAVEQERQLIWPYTDLLLHDMGDGLADRDGNGVVVEREWRTPPLWGIGLTQTVNGHQYFLHDGRARGLLEAILWHEGEATQSKDKVLKMDREQREKLLKFIESL